MQLPIWNEESQKLTRKSIEAIKVKDIRIQPSRLSHDDTDIIHEAIRIISDYCDGAQDEDGQGFNKRDTEFGKSLASQSVLSPKQAAAGLRMVYKYRRQLPTGIVQRLASIIYRSKLEPSASAFKIIPDFYGGKCVFINIVSTSTWKEIFCFNPESWSTELEKKLLDFGLNKLDIQEIVGILNIGSRGSEQIG
jgi:hypothetical protein